MRYNGNLCCSICGGTAGDVEKQGGAHNLCRELQKIGQPTPSRGDRCPDCFGNGRIPKSNSGPINPSQAVIDAWAPTCPTCNGSGAIERRVT